MAHLKTPDILCHLARVSKRFNRLSIDPIVHLKVEIPSRAALNFGSFLKFIKTVAIRMRELHIFPGNIVSVVSRHGLAHYQLDRPIRAALKWRKKTLKVLHVHDQLGSITTGTFREIASGLQRLTSLAITMNFSCDFDAYMFRKWLFSLHDSPDLEHLEIRSLINCHTKINQEVTGDMMLAVVLTCPKLRSCFPMMFDWKEWSVMFQVRADTLTELWIDDNYSTWKEEPEFYEGLQKCQNLRKVSIPFKKNFLQCLKNSQHLDTIVLIMDAPGTKSKFTQGKF